MGAGADACRSRASTTLRSPPARIRATAAATARSHCGALRLPSCQRTSPDVACARRSPGRAVPAPGGQPSGAGDPGPAEIVVSQARPSRRPSTACGTMRTDPSEAGSKVKLPNATSPHPGAPTWSSTSAPSSRARSHFSAAVNRSVPAGSGHPGRLAPPGQPLAPVDPGQRGGAGQPPGQIPGIGDRNGADHEPVRLPVACAA